MESHLLQMRGLKPELRSLANSQIWSHLLQMRGLKRARDYLRFHPFGVASFTDAWIETVRLRTSPDSRRRRIFYRCVD